MGGFGSATRRPCNPGIGSILLEHNPGPAHAAPGSTSSRPASGVREMRVRAGRAAWPALGYPSQLTQYYERRLASRVIGSGPQGARREW